LLHQVRSLIIRRTNDAKAGPLEFTLSVEGLALHSAPRTSELFPDGHETGGTVLAGAQREDFARLTQKNIFEPYHKPEQQNEYTIAPPTHVYLPGPPRAENGSTAWLNNRLTNENKLLRAGDELDIAGVKGTVTSVSRSGITVEMNNKRWSLDLGKNLQELCGIELSESRPDPAKTKLLGDDPARQASFAGVAFWALVPHPDAFSHPPQEKDVPSGKPAAELSETSPRREPVSPDARVIEFSFATAPWEHVFSWFSDICGLSLQMDVKPTGTFNYIHDPKKYTIG